MLGRDRGRFARCPRAAERVPARVPPRSPARRFPIDRHMTAQALGFDRPTANSLDAVSDRDFALEFLGGRRDLRRAPVAPRRGDRALVRRRSSASSACPTPSPPAARSCRRSATPTRPSWCAPRPAASSARSMALLIVMKGLPLAYSKDMQEDKEPAVRRADTLALCLAAMAGMVARPDARTPSGCAPRPAPASHGDRSRRLAGAGARPALPRGAPRHRPRSSSWPRTAASSSPNSRWRRCRRSSRASPQAVFDVLAVDASVASRTSFGGTAPEMVRTAVSSARERFL